jgi:hypothetical protein
MEPEGSLPCSQEPVNDLYSALGESSPHHLILKKKTRGFGPLANYADRATAAWWRGSANFCG